MLERVAVYEDMARADTLGDDIYRAHTAFHAALRRFAHVSDRHARAAGITPQQHELLLATRGHPSYPWVSVTEIAQSLRISVTSASELVSRTYRRGLLVRRHDEYDRRRTLVGLSELGINTLERITMMNRRELRTRELDALEWISASLRETP